MSDAETKRAFQLWVETGLSKPGKTNTELANLLGIPQSRVSEMRRGIRGPKLSELPIIAAYIEEPVPPGIQADASMLLRPRPNLAELFEDQAISLAEKLRTQRLEAERLAEARVAAARASAQARVQRSKQQYNDALEATGEQPKPEMVEVPLLTWVSAGKMSFPDVSEDMISLIRDGDLDPTGDWIALKVVGDSMDRISPPESIIFVDRKDKILVPNACYVISSNDGEATYKRFRPNPMRFEPVSTNPAHEPIYPTREPLIVGRVKKSTIEM